MATHGCSCLEYAGVCENAFYFTEAGTGVDEDTLDKSPITFDGCLIGSSRNKFLVLKDKHFQAKNLTSAERHQPECKFNIQLYRDNENGGQIGRAVIVYAIKDNKKIMVCCKDGSEICAEEMILPEQIPDRRHKAVFYRKDLLIGNKYLLQSSLYPTKFLAFEPDKNNHTLNKLVLHEKPEDTVDEGAEITIIRSN